MPNQPFPDIALLGEHHLLLTLAKTGCSASTLANQAKIWALAQECRSRGGLTDITPGMNNLTLCLDANQDTNSWQQWLQNIWPRLPVEIPDGRLHRVPVRYGNDHGPDLEAVARFHHTSAEEIIRAHCATEYRVMFLGFLPGFAYLSGLPSQLHTPRLDVPRQQVPAGSVGIGGAQTGIYPCQAPGGWQLIGRTELPLFDAKQEPPCRFAPGDRIQFVREVS
ncbi:5-oxoprolinase subunit PxpB [Shewanella khirikhana]|uniref:5-oxoprolinase subunit PxpB n=1 Tax=Shewanella khirikhana TaxID=1965282 RepID=UPI0030D60AC6